MEDLSALLLEERAHSEQFKTNFMLLKTEFDKLVIENARLNDEILKFKDYKPEEPNEVLKRRLKNAEKELQGKDHLIFSLQEKIQEINGSLKEKFRREQHITSKITSTETALEHTKMLLSHLQLETTALVQNLEKTRRTEENDHHRDLKALAEKCAKSDHEKKVIVHQVIKATNKAKKTTQLLKQDNELLCFSIKKLKESLDKVSWEKSVLSSQLETIKVQHGQERGEMLIQIRNLECDLTKLQAKNDSLERHILEAIREKEKAVLSFQTIESEKLKLQNDYYALQMKHDKATEQAKRDLEQLELHHTRKVEELNRTIHSMRNEFEEEKLKIQHQSEKLRRRESQLVLANEELHKKEKENSCLLQEAKITIENKYRTLLEEKFQIEMEISRKCAELESQLILERNIKPGLESEVCRLSSENELLCQRLRSSEDLLADKKRLQNAVEKLEKEKNTISEELCLQKLSAVEQRETMTKEIELAKKEQAISAENMSQQVNGLREQISQLQAKLVVSEQESETKVKRLQNSLKENQQKSQRYAKLIWKLRTRIANAQSVKAVA